MSAATGIRDQVFVLRGHDDQDEWRVAFAGRVEPATFNSRGAASAYLDALQRGTRKPEVARSATHLTSRHEPPSRVMGI